MRLLNKVVIVTGSTMGIGKAIARRCILEGGRVVLHGLEEEKGLELVHELGAASSCFCGGDLLEEKTALTLVEKALKHFGYLDAVVNNAAWVASSDIQTTDLPFFEKMLRINTLAPYLLIRHALDALQKRRGSILNIGSVNAYSGEPNLLAYSVSKGALMTLTRNLGDTLHRQYGVRVNQLNPGWVLTAREQERKVAQGLESEWYRNLPNVFAPAGRLLHPEEIAAAAVFWIGDECGPVSGQVVDLEQYPFAGRNPPKDATTLSS